MISRRTFNAGLGSLLAGTMGGAHAGAAEGQRHLLYVASPGIRNYTEFGGVGVLVYDVGAGYRWIKRIPTLPEKDGVPAENVKGVAACASTGRLYMTTPKRMVCLDLLSEKILWNREYEGGCDRMAMPVHGRFLYVPSFEGPHWNVIDGATGDVIKKIVTDSGAHNTIVGLDGRHAYLAGLKSPYLFVTDTEKHEVVRKVGPFSASIRPFTVNRDQSLCFVNVNELLGFEVGDLKTGQKLYRVEVSGYQRGPVKRHGCPSHGVGLTPDEKEIWVCDAANQMLHVFDATRMPPKQVTSIRLREQPGWVTFTLDGKHALPSTGEIIDVKSKQIVHSLSDETGRQVHSEKVVEIVFEGARPVRNGDQFGLGRKS